MKVLLWHVHGSWTTTFVHGPFDTVVPVTPERGPEGLGLPTTSRWPAEVREIDLRTVASEAPDVVVLQRPREAYWLFEAAGLRAGTDLPALYLEHNTPPDFRTRHPMADQDRIPVVHVTHFNRIMWDNGVAPCTVVEHGIADPPVAWTGELARIAVVVNEPLRRGRATGTDLLPGLASLAPVDVFGMGTEALTDPSAGIVGHGDLPHRRLLHELARRRLYVHTCRWTSLGLSLLEAMSLGMPAVGLAVTEAPEALAGSGITLSNDPRVLGAAIEELLRDHGLAAAVGKQARRHVQSRYGAARFHDDWQRLIEERVR